MGGTGAAGAVGVVGVVGVVGTGGVDAPAPVHGGGEENDHRGGDNLVTMDPLYVHFCQHNEIGFFNARTRTLVCKL